MLTIWSYISVITSGIRGRIIPEEGVLSIWLVSGKETLHHAIINGYFSIELCPGIYHLIVDAHSEYKDILLESVIVKEGRMTDMGDLVLHKITP